MSDDATTRLSFYPPPIEQDELDTALRYPTYWWDSDAWELLRQSDRQRNIIGAVANTDILSAGAIIMQGKKSIKHELEYLRALRLYRTYDGRMEEAGIEARDDPTMLDRMLYIGTGPNALSNQLFTALWTWPKPIIVHFKNHYSRARPYQLDPWLRPGLDLPGHASFPSGHSTQYHLVALVMDQVTGRRTDRGRALMWMAGRVAQNREFAGLHFPSDTDAGFQLAGALVPFFMDQHVDLIEKVRVEEWGLPGDCKLDEKRLRSWLDAGVVRDPRIEDIVRAPLGDREIVT